MGTTIGVTELREKISDVVNRAVYQGDRIMVQRHGKSVAAIISAEDLALFEELEDRLLSEAVRQARADGETPVPWDEAKARLET